MNEPAGRRRSPAALAAVVGKRGRGPAPVHLWDPPFCGDSGMRIAADGMWFHDGAPIRRPELVRLFASVLRRDPDGFRLVTPVEKLAIAVEDVPFVAVEMRVSGEAERRRLCLRTNVEDEVEVGPDRPLRFEKDAGGGLRPYVRVRGELWARLARPLVFDLVALGEERILDGISWFGVPAAGTFFPIAPATELPAA